MTADPISGTSGLPASTSGRVPATGPARSAAGPRPAPWPRGSRRAGWAGWTLVLLLAALPAWAGVRRLTHNDVPDRDPQINNAGQVVWVASAEEYSSPSEIYSWDGISIQQLTPENQSGTDPQINDGGQVLWWMPGGQLYLWDGATIRQVSDRPLEGGGARINRAGQVVWRDKSSADGQIFLWNGSTVQQLSQGLAFKSPPVINGLGQVAWLAGDGQMPGQAFLWSSGGVQTFPLPSTRIAGPQINDRAQLIWWGQGLDFRDHIYVWEDGNARQIPDDGRFPESPALGEGGHVAWTPGVNLWDGFTTRLIPDFYAQSGSVRVNRSGQMVWLSGDGIQYWNGVGLVSLTPPHTGSSPQINDAGQVVWSGWDGSDNEIYLYTPTGPGSIDLLSPDPVVEGATATGVVYLTAPAPDGGTIVTLASDRPEAAQVPASVTVPAGAAAATFPVTTAAVSATTPVTLTATTGGASWTTRFQVWNVAVRALTLPAPSLGGGVAFTGSVELDEAAPAEGAVVTLTSSQPDAVTVPDQITVPAGRTGRTFTGRTHPIARTATVTLSASYGGATRMAALQVRGGPPMLASLVLQPSSVFAGEQSQATVTLDGVAPQGGTVVRVGSDRPAVAMPPRQVLVPAGQVSVSFPVKTGPVRVSMNARLTAALGAVTRAALLEVKRPPIAALTLDPDEVTGGVPVRATLRLDRPAPAGGAAVQLFGAGALGVTVPDTLMVPEGQTTAEFVVSTEPVSTVLTVPIAARYQGQFLSARLQLLPIGLSSVTLEQRQVVGGQAVAGAVTLSGPAPAGGALVLLTVQPPGAALVPANLRIPAGATSAAFTVTTRRVRGVTPVFVAARFAGVTRGAMVTLLPGLPVTVSVQPPRITGGLAATGSVYLRVPAPAGGARVSLESNRPSLVRVPAQVTVPAGALSATFPVQTSVVGSPASIVIRATYGGAAHAETLVLLPVPPPADGDRVQVLPLATNDLAYDPVSGRLYASAPVQVIPGIAGFGNSVIWVDPFAGVPGAAIPLASEPGRLALAAEGRVLYTTVQGAGAVQRLDLATESAGVPFALGSDPTYGPYVVEDMEVLPGQPDAVAIARAHPNLGRRHAGVAVYDNGVQRPETPPAFTNNNAIEFSGAASRLYGADTEGQEGFQRLAVDASGVSLIDSTPDLVVGIGGDIQYADGRIYTTTGRVIDPETRTIVGRFAGIPDGMPMQPVPPTLVCADPAAGRVYFLTGSGSIRTLLAYDAATFAPVGSLTVPGVLGTASRLIRWGQERDDAGGGLAFRTSGGQLFLIRTRLVTAARLTVSLTPATVQGGSPASGTVTLRALAPAGGVVVTLESGDPAAAAVPASVTVPAGATSARFPVTTTPVGESHAVPIRATAGGARAVTRLQVLAPVLTAFSIGPNPIANQGAGEGMVELSGPAPAGGAVVTLSGEHPPSFATLPPSVTVPAGATKATFPISQVLGSCGSDLIFHATYGATRSVLLRVWPEITGPTFYSPDVVGGQTAQGEFSTTCFRYADLTFSLTSDNPALAAVPETVTLRPSDNSVRFGVKTRPVSSPTTVTITATMPGLVRTVTLRLVPLALASVTVYSTIGGNVANGMVTLNAPAPAGGFPVRLSSDQPAVAVPPGQVVVPAGETSATFQIQTQAVPTQTLVTIRASAGGVQRSADLTVIATGLRLTRTRAFAGESLLAYLVLPSPAPPGAVATITSSDPAVAKPTYPQMGFFPFNPTTAEARIDTSPIDTPKTVVFSATYQGTTWTATLEVLPVPVGGIRLLGAPVVSGGALPGAYVLSGSTIQGRVNLNYPAPVGGVVVNLSTDLNYIITVPEKVTVPEGARSADFPISIRQYDYVVSATLRAEVGYVWEVKMLLLPGRLSFAPNTVEAGQVATGILFLPAPAPSGGAVVSLSDTSGGFLSYAPTVTVPAGQSIATFPVRFEPGGTRGPVTMTATYVDQSWSAVLNGPP